MVTMKNFQQRDMARAFMALALFFAAGVACVNSGDQAPTSGSSGSTTNATLSGTITAAGGGAISGARVATDRGNYSTTTNASGQYTLAVAGNNIFAVSASYNGYKTVVRNGVRVQPGQSVTGNMEFTTLLASGEKTYIGSSQCRLCHSTQHTRWTDAPHRFGMGAPGEATDGILAAVEPLFTAGTDLSTNAAFLAYGANAPKLSKSGDTYYITIGAVAYPVTYTMGYQWKQRYVTTIGEAHYILPIQYNISTSAWTTYNTGNWYSGVTPLYASSTSLETDIYKMNSWERKCMGCHSVTGILSLEYSASPTSGISQHRAGWVERGIGCEACHGPASAHVWANGAIGTTSNPYIINPAKLTRDRAMDICGQCHSRGLSVGKLAGQSADNYNATSDTYSLEYFFKSNQTFRPGDVLVDGYTDGGNYWTDTYSEVKSSTGHHQQWNDMYQSAHLAANAADSVTCVSCHDAHGPVGGFEHQLKLNQDDNTLCLTCHGSDGVAEQRFGTDSQILEHTGTQHRTYNPSSRIGRCVACHMLKIVTSATTNDLHSHTFRTVNPRNSYRASVAGASSVIPNTCNKDCHQGSAGRGTNFGAGTAGYLLAAQNYDSTVQRNDARTPDTPIAVITGTVGVTGASSFADTFGVWVSLDHTSYSCVTSRNGSYYLVADAPGTYVLRAVKPGYDSITLVVYVDTASKSRVSGVNLTLTATGVGPQYKRSTRCMACHGATIGAEWRQSGFEGVTLSEAEGVTELASGHALMQQSPAGNTGCHRCHEGRAAEWYLTTRDTNMVGATTAIQNEKAGRHALDCMVCHTPHPVAGNSKDNLRQWSDTVVFDTGYFYPSNAGLDSSMSFPPAYKATVCLMCHNQRTAPRDSGTGYKLSGGSYVPVSTPHVGNNSEGFFGIRGGGLFGATNPGVSGAAYRFDSYPVAGRDTPSGVANLDSSTWRPRNSTHSDTNWGQTFRYQAFVYSGGAPKLVSANGAPVVRSAQNFTCLSCHMTSQDLGTTSNGVKAAWDGGHSFKPDIRACGTCHDPVYITLNPYTNALKAGSGDATWGTGSWGVSSANAVLGFDRPVTSLPHQKDSGSQKAGTTALPAAADGIFNDYNGNGVAEGSHTEAKLLFERVQAAMNYGTQNGETSGIGASGTDGLGDTMTAEHPYWTFNKTRGTAGTLSKDELRVAWNLVLMEHDETNIGIHNLRFAIETLRACWTVVGRQVTGDLNWTPPGDDY